jgi:hypothetical protein
MNDRIRRFLIILAVLAALAGLPQPAGAAPSGLNNIPTAEVRKV